MMPISNILTSICLGRIWLKDYLIRNNQIINSSNSYCNPEAYSKSINILHSKNGVTLRRPTTREVKFQTKMYFLVLRVHAPQHVPSIADLPMIDYLSSSSSDQHEGRAYIL